MPPARSSSSPARRRAKAAATAGRAAWGTISREQVVETATQIVVTGGFEQLTVRGLAAELGVSPMSLYRHVRDKDDLLDEVVDRLLTDVWRPRRSEADGRAWIAEAADNLRGFLVSQPAALHVYLRHPAVSPAAVTRMEAMLRVLHRETGGEEQARQAFAAIQTYTIGFAALEAARDGWQPTSRTDDALARQLAANTTPEQFARGLNYLLQGIDHQQAARISRRR